MNKIIDWLEKQHDQIMQCESDAMSLLAKDDSEGYRAKMREKAELLSTLAERAKPVLDGLPASQRTRIEQKLGQFSSSADTALALGSVFYMSALLYRDDHKRGEPDNLEIFIQELKKH